MEREIIGKIICCPDCLGAIQDKQDRMACPSCKQEFVKIKQEGYGVNLLSKRSDIKLTALTGQFGVEEKKTRISGLVKAVWPPEPVRFYGDMQFKTGIKNYHEGLDKFVKASGGSGNAVILDIGSGDRRIAPNVVNIDVYPGRSIDIIADAAYLPLKTESADAAIIQTMLEHTPDYIRVIENARRVLKPGGKIFCEVPFYYPRHGKADFVRFTPEMIKGILTEAGFQIDECRISMGPFSSLALSLINSLSVIFSFGFKKLYTVFFIIFGWLLFWLKYLDIVYPDTALDHTAPVFYCIGRRK